MVVVSFSGLVGLLWVGGVWGLGGEGCRRVRVCVGVWVTGRVDGGCGA